MQRSGNQHDVAARIRPAKRPGRFDWWTEAFVVALTAAEAAIVWLVVDLALVLTADSVGGLPPLAVFVLIYAGVAVPRWLEAADLWEPWFQVGLIAAIGATTLVAIKLASYPARIWFDDGWLRDAARALIVRPNQAEVAVWGIVLLSAYAWWRGRRHEEPDLDAAYLLLRVGTLVTLVTVAVRAWAVDGIEQEQRGSTGAVLVFFAGALGAIAIGRMRLERTRGTSPIDAGWLPAFLGPVALIAIAATVAVGLFSREALETLLWLLAPAFWALSVVFRVLILLIALIAFIIVSPILWLLSGHQFNFAGIRIAPSPIGPEGVIERGADHASAVPDPVRYLIAATVLATLFSIAARFILRRRRRARPLVQEERESVLRATDLLLLATAALRRLLRRAPRAADSLDALRADPRWASTIAIRETYRRFLEWSRDQHVARAQDATPLEHAAALRPLLTRASGESDLTVLTQHYLDARYSGRPATATEAASARAAWRRLHRTPGRG